MNAYVIYRINIDTSNKLSNFIYIIELFMDFLRLPNDDMMMIIMSIQIELNNISYIYSEFLSILISYIYSFLHALNLTNSIYMLNKLGIRNNVETSIAIMKDKDLEWYHMGLYMG